jgi:hypothetical protein
MQDDCTNKIGRYSLMVQALIYSICNSIYLSTSLLGRSHKYGGFQQTKFCHLAKENVILGLFDHPSTIQ